MNVVHVLQQDPYGCLVACIAMATGHSYTDVRIWFTEKGLRFDGDGCGGLTHFAVEDYLGDHGFAYARKYRWFGANHQRPTWPVAPFAPVHICGTGRHGIVMLNDGNVLDPLFAEQKALADYPDIGYVIGVWQVAS